MKSKNNKSFNKFLFLWFGELVSAIGSGLTSFGLVVYIFQQTGSAAAMALVTFLAFVPSLLLSPVAGVLADRYDRRLLMVLGDSLSVIGLVYILIALLQGEAQLWQICVGVTISSIFSSLLDPAYKATVTDLLTEEQYTKASGLVQIASSSKFLISPIIAGFLLTVANIELILIIDICTFFLTVATTLVVRKGLAPKAKAVTEAFMLEMKAGWQVLAGNKGILILVSMGAVLTFLLGFIETLSLPMILSFSTSAVAGSIQSISATGILVTSVIIGIISIKKGYVKMLALSLFMEGIFIAVFGLRENLLLIGIAGFLLFASIPFTNASLDYLIRTNIDNEVQGRAWSFIGLISQLGYIVAYAISGVLADYVFIPLLKDGGALAGTVGQLFGTGEGRGIGLEISLAGLLLCVTAIVIYNIKSIQQLERRGTACYSEQSVMTS